MLGASRTVSVVYDAKVAGYIAGVRRMQSATTDFVSRASRASKVHSAEWDRVGTGMLVAGAAGAVGLGYIVNKAAEFEQKMSLVGAVTDASAAQMASLSDAALKAGEDTVFSATEAADAQAELAKAGVSTSDILGGALTGALDLAAASGISLTDAAETAGQAMNLFGLEGKDVTHVADVLTASANKSAAGVDDLSLALSQGGTLASATGLSLEETVAALSAFADQGMKGSDAGTSLKTMLQRLNPQSEAAASTMEALGINAYDAQGEFVGLEALAGQLQGGLAGMSAEQRNAALQTMFGSDAVRAANILYKEGADGIAEYVAAVMDQGAAARMAKRMTDNLKGDLEGLAGALETAFIETGSGGTEALRGVVQGVESVVSKYNEMPKAAQTGVFYLGLVATAALLTGGAFMKATTFIATYKAALATLGASGAKAAAAMGLVSKAAGVGLLAYGVEKLNGWSHASQVAKVDTAALAGEMSQLTQKGAELGPQLEQAFTKSSWNTLPMFREEVVTTEEAIERFGESANNSIPDNAFEKVMGYGASHSKLKEQINKTDTALAEMVRSGNAEQAKKSLDAMLSGVDPAKQDEIRAQFVQTQEALDTLAVAAEGTVEPVNEMNAAMDANGDQMVDSKEKADAYRKTLDEVKSAITALGGGFRAEQQAIADAGTAYSDAMKVVGGSSAEQQAALRDLSAKYLEVSSAQVEMGRGSGEVTATMEQQRAKFLEVAGAMGYSKPIAEGLADAMGLVPSEVSTLVSVTGAETAAERVKNLDQKILDLNGKEVSVREAGADPSAGRVLKLKGQIEGLPGKNVTVRELGATASGDRVVSLKGKIYVLKGKQVDITADASQATGAISAVERARINDKSFTITAFHKTIGDIRTYGQPAAGAFPWKRADGGIDRYADGGLRGRPFDTTVGAMRPGIYPVTRRGIWMAEEGAGPWEGYVSGHPRKRSRSRAITSQIVGMLGGSVDWGDIAGTAFASGGVWGSLQDQLGDVQRLARRYPIRIFEDYTARWVGSGRAPSKVQREIDQLHRAQDRWEDALDAPRRAPARRSTPTRRSASASQSRSRAAANRRATEQRRKKAAEAAAEYKRIHAPVEWKPKHYRTKPAALGKIAPTHESGKKAVERLDKSQRELEDAKRTEERAREDLVRAREDGNLAKIRNARRDLAATVAWVRLSQKDVQTAKRYQTLDRAARLRAGNALSLAAGKRSLIEAADRRREAVFSQAGYTRKGMVGAERAHYVAPRQQVSLVGQSGKGTAGGLMQLDPRSVQEIADALSVSVSLFPNERAAGTALARVQAKTSGRRY